ncbi:MAG: M55 family metallopeptidase [Anaerolineae bacterium]
MRIYIMTDFEGACAVTGVPGEPLTQASSQYQFARRMVTAEINAAVEGAIAGGATDIIVNDSHGGGLNLIYDELHPEARYVMGVPRPEQMSGLERGFAGVFLVAYHAMAGTENGVLSHSFSSVGIQNMWLNGERIGEIGIAAALAGALDVPVILATSDTAGVAEARALLGESVRTVAVKQGLGRNCAISLHPAKAQALIRQAAEDAVRHAGDISPLSVRPPYRLRTEYKLESAVDQALGRERAQARRIDSRTIEVVGDDLSRMI